MKQFKIIELNEKVGQSVEVTGWVNNIRSHGKISFIDLRDVSGIVQVFVSDKLSDQVSELGHEDVITIKGEVKERPEKLVNPNIDTGKIELSAQAIGLVSKSDTPPFEVNKDTLDIDERLRLKHRYLDLRTERMSENIVMRHKLNLFLRNHLSDQDFFEIETPMLGKGTPEGAREFLVPSRKKGKFYVLPQSPQQFKQLLMVSGFEKYFQIARCFRDEDQRGDRQPEFTQLDMEMSFVDQEDVLATTEAMLIALVEEVFPDKKIKQVPFPVFDYDEAMDKFGTDKPDLRESDDELAFCWVVNFPLFEDGSPDKKYASAHHPFTMPSEDTLEMLDNDPLKVKSYAYDIALNGFEIGGGSIRIHDPELQKRIFDVLEIPQDEARVRFGHMLDAFKYGAPPHGGIALGLDRLLAVIQGEDNIREVIAFPKMGDGSDPMTGAPTSVSEEALGEVGISVESEDE